MTICQVWQRERLSHNKEEVSKSLQTIYRKGKVCSAIWSKPSEASVIAGKKREGGRERNVSKSCHHLEYQVRSVTIALGCRHRLG